MIFWIFVVVCAALTLYCATAILPFSSTTNVERITPVFGLVSSLLPDRQVAEQLGHVPSRFHVVLRHLNLALVVDNKG